VRCTVLPAQLRNDAGIIGAAIVAAEAPGPKPAEMTLVSTDGPS
jgi:hypothetical protein